MARPRSPWPFNLIFFAAVAMAAALVPEMRATAASADAKRYSLHGDERAWRALHGGMHAWQVLHGVDRAHGRCCMEACTHGGCCMETCKICGCCIEICKRDGRTRRVMYGTRVGAAARSLS
eukprot:366216-Chlamydomonas_euryale.AAC.13